MSLADTTSDDIVAALLDSATDFLNARHSPARCKGGVGVPGPIDAALWREMAQMGWTGLSMPESLGGSGLGLRGAAALSELFGRLLVPEPLIAASVMPAAILAHGSSSLINTLATMLIEGERPITLAWQERPQQLEPESPSLRFRNGKLQGSKLFVAVADDNALLIVWADADGEPALFAVDAVASGITRLAVAAGLSTLSTIQFDDAAVIGDQPLLRGASAIAAMQSALLSGTVCAAAQLCGLAAGALQKTLDYVSDRTQFGRAIGSFQTIHHRCADLYVATQLAGASWREAARTASPLAVAAAKARCGDTALTVAREAVQMHGAMGFTEEADIGLYLRTSLHLSSWLGTPTMQRRRFMNARASDASGVAHV